MAKKKVTKKSPARSSSRSSQGVFQKHPSLLLYLVLLVGVVVIMWLMFMYKDAQNAQDVMDVNSMDQMPLSVTPTPSISPTAAQQPEF